MMPEACGETRAEKGTISCLIRHRGNEKVPAGLACPWARERGGRARSGRTIFLLRLRLRDEGERAHRRCLDGIPEFCGWREGDGSKPPNGAFALGGHRCPATRRARFGGGVRRIRRRAGSGSCRGPPARGRRSGGWPRAGSGSGPGSARWRWPRWSGRRDCAAGGARTPGNGLHRR